MFSGFSFPAGKFRKEWWSPCREPQEFVHRTLSAASYAKKKLVIPSLPARGWGELAASMQDAWKYLRIFSFCTRSSKNDRK